MATHQNLVLRTVYISPEVDEKLRVEAFDGRTSKNDLIRKYIKLGMKQTAVIGKRPASSGGEPALKGKARRVRARAAAKR